jgi:hypothetical protein
MWLKSAMDGGRHASAFTGLLLFLMLHINAMDEQQQPFATPGSAKDLRGKREGRTGRTAERQLSRKVGALCSLGLALCVFHHPQNMVFIACSLLLTLNCRCCAVACSPTTPAGGGSLH